MRGVLIGLVLAALAPAARAEVLWGEGCYYRKYSDAHLAAHPRQQVMELAIRLVGEDVEAKMDIFARVRPIAGHSVHSDVEYGAAAKARLSCSVEDPEAFGKLPESGTMCGNPNSCSLDEWVRLTELDGEHAVIEDGSYAGAGSVAVPIGDEGGVFIGEEVECESDDAACNAANPSVRYRMERADPKVCAAIFDDVRPEKGCGP